MSLPADLSPPAPGQARPLSAGVHWARLPVPGPLRHINVWLLEDGDGWTLIDTGMDVPAAREAWQGPLAAYLGGRPLTRILCTHHHPDHAGLAAWLSDRYRAPVLMSAREFALLKRLAGAASDPDGGEWRVEGFRRAGLEASEGTRAALSGALYRTVVSGIPDQVRGVIADGDRIEIGTTEWRALVVAGHTDAQVVLHAARAGLLIASDQVLPRITSNVGIYPERDDADPVASFLASFAKLEALEPEPAVLPSHGDVFVGLRARLSALRTHHEATLARVRGLVVGATTARELAERLFRGPLEGLNLTLAVGEALAHLEHLALRGEMAREDVGGGPWRYRPLVDRHAAGGG